MSEFTPTTTSRLTMPPCCRLFPNSFEVCLRELTPACRSRTPVAQLSLLGENSAALAAATSRYGRCAHALRFHSRTPMAAACHRWRQHEWLAWLRRWNLVN